MSFELPQEIKDLSSDATLPVQRKELLEALIVAEEKAWETAIQPRMQTIRDASLNSDQMKKGIDFFTEADVESEKIIKEELMARFGQDTFRFFGEEEDAYTGNLDSPITIRIDPIDGTASFKFGEPTWSIMVGAYIGRDSEEKQIVSAMYFPEYYEEVLFRVDAAGVFLANIRTGDIRQFGKVLSYDNVRDIIIAVHKANVFEEMGKIDDIVRELEELGARVRSIYSARTKEALETRGKRAFIIEGDFNEVDFILFSVLIALGYKLFTFDGNTHNIDDPAVSNEKFILIPPGKAGEKILEIVRKYSV